jgi:hypothetical protein
MSPKRVATTGEVTATVSTTLVKPATTGVWAAGTIHETPHDKLKAAGSKALREAKCTFRFTGSDSSGAAVAGTEDVTLSATATLLQKQHGGVLLDADNKAGDTYGNTLTAHGTKKWSSA